MFRIKLGTLYTKQGAVRGLNSKAFLLGLKKSVEFSYIYYFTFWVSLRLYLNTICCSAIPMTFIMGSRISFSSKSRKQFFFLLNNKFTSLQPKWNCSKRFIGFHLVFCSDYLFKLLLIGDSGVGKSCLLLRYAVSCQNA